MLRCPVLPEDDEEDACGCIPLSSFTLRRVSSARTGADASVAPAAPAPALVHMSGVIVLSTLTSFPPTSSLMTNGWCPCRFVVVPMAALLLLLLPLLLVPL